MTVKLSENGYVVTYDNGSMRGQLGSYENDKEVQDFLANGGVIEPEFTEAELQAQQEYQAKLDKLQALKTLTVKTSNGNTFDGNETARINMLCAINRASRTGETSSIWKLADNSSAVISLDELQEAHDLAIIEVGKIVGAIQ
jgi:hypothetical protein